MLRKISPNGRLQSFWSHFLVTFQEVRFFSFGNFLGCWDFSLGILVFWIFFFLNYFCDFPSTKFLDLFEEDSFKKA